MLGGSLEENVLTALVHSDTLAPHIAISVKSNDFSVSAYRHIAAGAMDFLERHRRAPRAHIADVLEHEIRRGQDGRFILQVLEQINNLAPSLNEEYVRAELDRFIETQRLINAVNNAADLLHDGNLEQARDILRAPNLLAPKDSPGVWLRDSAAWLSFLRDSEEDAEFSSGIEVLDDRGVRPARGELYAMLAAAGMGKSWFLVNAGAHNLHHRRNVLHVTLENSLAVTQERYTQCLLSCTRDEAKHIDLPVLEARDGADERRIDLNRGGSRLFDSLRGLGRGEVERRLEPYQSRGQLLVKHFPTGVLTLGMLNAYLDSLEQTEHFRPDLLLIDYLTLMRIDGRDLRISIGQLTANLRGLASLRNCAVVTAVQANREAANRRWVGSSNVAEDWSIVGTCDTFLTYSQTPFERDKQVARVTVAKARNASDKWTAYVAQAYEIGQFALNSCYHSQLKEQLDEDEKSA